MGRRPTMALITLSAMASISAALAGTAAIPPVTRVIPAAASSPVKYTIDPSQSKFIVRAFAGGVFSVFAHDHTIAIRDFRGSAEITPDTIEPASLQMNINANSLAVIDKVSDKDRREIESTMRDEVLETKKYSEIVFKSSKIDATRTGEGRYKVKIWGELNLHGVPRTGLITADLTLSGTNLRARGEFPLKQSDYNIKPPSLAGGTVRVKDQLKFSFDIVAVKQ